MKRFFLALFAAISFSLLGGLFSSSSVNAASPFDNIIREEANVTSPPYIIRSSNGNQTYSFDRYEDIILYFFEYDRFFEDRSLCGSNWEARQSNYEDFLDLLATGNPSFTTIGRGSGSSIYISLYVYENSNVDDIVFNWRENPAGTTRSLQFVNSSGPTPYKWVHVELGDNGQLQNCSNPISTTATISPVVARLSDPEVSTFSSSTNTQILYLQGIDIEYPEDYEGIEIRVGPEPELKNLQPHFNFHINKNGKITWQYLKNISPFLTGIFFTNIDKMNENWDGLAPEGTIHQNISNPAGWLDEEWILPGEGYYQFNISHSQQLDNPPWTDQNFHIQQTFLQFYWDGESEVNGTNIGCSGSELCNPFKSEHSDTWNIFNSLDNINTFGLTAFITAPLNFIGTLPDKVNTCEPIEFAWLNDTITLTCMRDRYQEWSPTVFAIWQTVVSAVVAFGVSYALFRNIKDMNSPDKDGIEVAKL